MSKIKILDPFTANQIAAGEVVERPVSVVKELLENAVDAGAGRVKISLIEGGLKQIQVVDNGFGMSPEEMLLACRRHATSKITTADDLNHLVTLGFRGEALPSIASVSNMMITTRVPGSTTGYQTVIKGGEPSPPEEVGCPVGTHVCVDDLFFNTPARKKFLKSPSAEMAQITDLVGRIAMSRPEVAFELEGEGRILIKTPGSGELAAALFAVYGGEIARGMNSVHWQGAFGAYSGNACISGFVSRPEMTRSSRHYYNFFINGRLVRSSELNRIMEEVFYTRIPAKRYPLAVIHFQLPPESFDVNVHPAKLEVRFRDPALLYQIFSQVLTGLFSRPEDAIPQLYMKAALKPAAEQKEVDESEHHQAAIFSDDIKTMAEGVSEDTSENISVRNSEDISGGPKCKTPEEIKEPTPIFSSYRVIGQMDGSYILAEGPEGLYIIDQHAAHERIRYERISKLFAEQGSAYELLAVPVTVELSAEQSIWLVDHILDLSDLGFILEHFGDNTFLLRGVPRWNAGGNSEELFLDIVEKLGNGSFDIKRWAESNLFSIACKGAVKANRFLSEGDIAYLMRRLAETENPYSCPHGRPVLIKLTREEIKKKFLRS